MKRLKCFMKKMKWKSMGVKWDGHCWKAIVSTEHGRGVICMDCGKKQFFSEDELWDEEYWNDR